MQNAISSSALPATDRRDRFRFYLIWLAAFLVLISLAQPAAAGTSPEGAARFLQALSERTLGVLNTKSPATARRQPQIRALLEENFALALIGRYVAGSAWRKASPDQRARYQRSFKSWVLNGFSKRLAAFSGAGMEITGTRAVGRRDVLVSTRLFRSSGPAVRAAWRIRAMNGGYKILDIMVEGVSMALTQRAEFASVIRRQGLDGLIRRLHAQTAQAQPQPQPSRQLASSQN